jgi:hypothetical protein
LDIKTSISFQNENGTGETTINLGGEAMVMAQKKEMTRAWLGNVPEAKVFWCHDGRVVQSLEELAAALREMPEETFRYHVTKDKNDFRNWVSDVIGDTTLANQLGKASNQTTYANKVETRLSWLRARV